MEIPGHFSTEIDSTFNAFGASLKLALSGYSQNSALILRDVLETVFLTDYFAGDRTLIERWRFADKKARIKDFGPVRVREALDARDGQFRRAQARADPALLAVGHRLPPPRRPARP